MEYKEGDIVIAQEGYGWYEHFVNKEFKLEEFNVFTNAEGKEMTRLCPYKWTQSEIESCFGDGIHKCIYVTKEELHETKIKTGLLKNNLLKLKLA